MRRLLQAIRHLLGSLTIAVPLLIAIGAVLAWGTIYEARFGTAAVQEAVYQSWWFQTLLGFLVLNLAVAALQRYPWQRRHLPFLLAHASIILILLGGIVGGRFGIHGQLLIPEGSSQKTIELSQKILVVHQANPGIPHAIPTRFETRAWVQEPNATFPIDLDGRALWLTVDRYYPDAAVEEEMADGGSQDNPAVRVRLVHQEQQDDVWLLARDPQRFGVSWGESHVLFLDAKSEEQGAQLLGRAASPVVHPRGVIAMTLPNEATPREVPVPEQLSPQAIEIPGTPYRVAFHDYFPDFAMSEAGLFSQSNLPNNPAVSFTLAGPEGTDPYLLFAFHPDFSSIHGVEYRIPATVRYAFTPEPSLPPRTIGLVRFPSGRLALVLTDHDGHKQVIDPLVIGADYTHPDLGYHVAVTASYERARALQHFRPRGDEVRMEALHVIAREGTQTAEAWLTARTPVELALGKEPVVVEYRSAQHELPVSVKLLDFRKIDYPGSQMAAGFESDVELTDPKRGLILMRKISMNHPLRYRNFSFYQSSFIPGDPEVTILSVRSDPGTPLVYAGFIVVIVGVVGMFILRAKFPEATAAP